MTPSRAARRCQKEEADAVAEFYASRGKVALDPQWPGLPEWNQWLSAARWLHHPRPDLLQDELPLWWLARVLVRMDAEADAVNNDE